MLFLSVKIFSFQSSVLWIIVFFLLDVVLFVRFQNTASDYLVDIFKLVLKQLRMLVPEPQSYSGIFLLVFVKKNVYILHWSLQAANIYLYNKQFYPTISTFAVQICNTNKFLLYSYQTNKLFVLYESTFQPTNKLSWYPVAMNSGGRRQV